MTTTNTTSYNYLEAVTADVLTLGKCAYIFHWSNSTYFWGSKDQRAEKNAVNKALKSIHKNPEKGANLPYTVGVDGYVRVIIDGMEIAVNDKMIANVSGNHPHGDIINGRTFKPLRPIYEAFKPGTFGQLWDDNRNEVIWGGAKMKSFHLESFPGADNLNYYRVSFRNNRLDFIVSDGKLYNAGCEYYAELTPTQILDRLDAESKTARNIITKLLDYLTA